MSIRKQIPFWGWFNGSLQHSLAETLESAPHQSVSEFYSTFKNTQIGGQDFPLKNQALTLGLLYSVLVVPREIWEQDENGGTDFPFHTEDLFSVTEGSYDDTWHFLRLIRNSVSHANFEITANGEYTFWNKQQSGDVNFKVSIMHSDIFNFINELANYYLLNVARTDILNDI